jgi:putative endopeptidase
MMKVRNYLPILALCLMGTSCGWNKAASLSSGIDVANLDTTAVPGTSFYQFANGGWMQKHPLTNEYSRFGSFDMLAENNRKQLRELIENWQLQSMKKVA